VIGFATPLEYFVRADFPHQMSYLKPAAGLTLNDVTMKFVGNKKSGWFGHINNEAVNKGFEEGKWFFSLLVIKSSVIGCRRTLRSFAFLRWPSDR
jgi:hypothetical protein